MPETRTRRPGTKVTAGEKRRYEKCRSADWSIPESAKHVGVSVAWAYEYEKEIARKDLVSQEPVGPSKPTKRPKENLSTAVDLLLTFRRDDPEGLLEIVENYEWTDILFTLTDLCLFVSTLYVRDYIKPNMADGEGWTQEEIEEAKREEAEAGMDDLDMFLGVVPRIMDQALRKQAAGDGPDPLSKGAPALDEGYREWLLEGEPESATNSNGRH